MAVAAMLYIVDAAKQLIFCQSGRIPSLHRKRYLVPVERLLDEDGDCAGHGETHAAEEFLCAALGFVVDPEVYLCHGSLFPLRRELYQTSDSNVNGLLYNVKGFGDVR